MAFAHRRRVKRGRVYAWLARFREEGVLAPLSPAVVEVVREAAEPGSGIVVRLGGVAIEFGEGMPPAAWIAELAERC